MIRAILLKLILLKFVVETNKRNLITNYTNYTNRIINKLHQLLTIKICAIL